MEMISNIIKHEKVSSLPEPVCNMFEFMLKLFNQVQKLATSHHIRPENFDANEPLTEYFPSLLLHLERVNFKVDKEDFPDDETIEDDCNKDYPRAPKMTPGLAHIFCRHGICKGFVSMNSQIFSLEDYLKLFKRSAAFFCMTRVATCINMH